jgi:hypothetical protein
MTHLLRSSTIFLAAVSASLSCAATTLAVEPGYESEDALLSAVHASIQKKSKADFLACSCVARLTDNLKARFEATTPTFITHQMESIKVRPGAENPFKGLEGFEYNIPYQGIIEVKYEGMEKPIPMPYGKYQGRYYLATLVKQGTFPN